MKTLICYKSYFGSTERYANWLAESTNADLLRFKDMKPKTLDEYKQVVVMSGTYAGHMPLVRFLKHRWGKLKDKKVIVIAIGGAPVDDDWSKKSYERIPKNIRNHVQYFKLIGKTDEKSIGLVKKSNLDPVIAAMK